MACLAFFFSSSFLRAASFFFPFLLLGCSSTRSVAAELFLNLCGGSSQLAHRTTQAVVRPLSQAGYCGELMQEHIQLGQLQQQDEPGLCKGPAGGPRTSLLQTPPPLRSAI